MKQDLIGPLVWIGTAAVALLAVWAAYMAVFDPDDIKPQTAVIFAAISAIAGWMLSAYMTRRNSTKQHTMNVLTQVRISPEMNERIKTLYSAFPGSKPMDTAYVEANLNPTSDAIKAAQYILNYYEFLAVSVRYGDLDHNLLRDCVRGQFCATYVKLSDYIDHAVKSDPRQPSRRYSDIRRLYSFWSK